MSFLTADTGGTGSAALDHILPYLNLGIIVVLVLLVVTKTGIVPKWSLDDAERRHKQELNDAKDAHLREMALKDAQLVALQNDKEELKNTNAQLTRVAQEQFLPALIEANRLTALYVDTIARRDQHGPPAIGPGSSSGST